MGKRWTKGRMSSRPARWRAGALIGVLTALLGFAIAVQVRANSSEDSLNTLRSDDLIGILDNQNARSERLREQIAELQQTLRKLTDSGDNSQAAREQAERDRTTLGVLLGTLPATGPGVQVTIRDPESALEPEDLLAVIEELRGAGAEAIAVGSLRIGPNSAFTTRGDALSLDGTALHSPYQVAAIGDPKTLDTALSIPGGIAAVIRSTGGELGVQQRDRVDITAVRPLPPTPQLQPTGD